MIKRTFFLLLSIFFFLGIIGIAEANYQGSIGTLFTISGEGFGIKKPTVYLEYEKSPGVTKKVNAKVLTYSDTSITCLWTSKVSPGEYNLWVKPNIKGANPSKAGVFSIMNPDIGSFVLNTNTVALYGKFFSSKKPTIYLEDLTTSKRKSCKLLRYSMEPETGVSSLEFSTDSYSLSNSNLIIKNAIGEVKLLNSKMQQSIGSKGGSIAVLDSNSPLFGTILNIPQNALDVEVGISLGEGHLNIGTTKEATPSLELLPDGLKFNKKASLALPVKNDYQNDTNIILKTYDPSTQQFVTTKHLGPIDRNSKTVLFNIEHFTTYQGEGAISIDITNITPSILTLDSTISIAGNVYDTNHNLLSNYTVGIEDPVSLSSTAIKSNEDGSFSYVTSGKPSQAGIYLFTFYDGETVVQSLSLSIPTFVNRDFDLISISGGQLDGQPDAATRLLAKDNSRALLDLSPSERKEVFNTIVNIFKDTLRKSEKDLSNNEIFRDVFAYTAIGCGIPDPTVTKVACVGGALIEAGIVINTVAKDFANTVLDYLDIDINVKDKIRNIISGGFMVQSTFNLLTGIAGAEGNNLISPEHINSAIKGIKLTTDIIESTSVSDISYDKSGNINGFTLDISTKKTTDQDAYLFKIFSFLHDTNNDGIPDYIDACTYTVSAPTESSFDASGGSGSVTVTAPVGCTGWTATSSVPWITISISGNTVTFSVESFCSATPRTGSITVAGQTFNITQNGLDCTYTVSAPTKSSFDASGGSGSVTVTAPVGCTGWTATSSVSWITVSISGSTVNFSVESFCSATPRTGSITVAGQTVTITQQGASNTVNLSGYWNTYHTEPGSSTEMGPDFLNISQTGNTISGYMISGTGNTAGTQYPLSGTTNGNTIESLSWTQGSITVVLTGTVNGYNMSGTYRNSDGHSGSWRAVKS
jgi:hypothetical protein